MAPLELGYRKGDHKLAHLSLGRWSRRGES
jgi:hypothetical protein